MSHIGQYAEIHYTPAHENEEMQRKRRDKGGEMSESWAAGCILQSAWDTSECVSLCAPVCTYVCVSLGEKKHIPTHSIPWFNRACTRRGLEREKKSDRERALFQRKRERREMEKREKQAKEMQWEWESVSLSTPHRYAATFLSAGVQAVLWRERLLGRRWGEFGRFEVFLLLMASARQDMS